jgi:hypothetical protein
LQELSVEKQNEMYSEYSKNRMSGTIDAYGREIRPEGGKSATVGTLHRYIDTSGKGAIMVQLKLKYHNQKQLMQMQIQKQIDY